MVTALQSQDSLNSVSEQDSPKFHISLGLGWDHEIIGAKFLYKFTDKTSAFVNIGVNTLVSFVPAIGLEHYFISQSSRKRFSPFISAQLNRGMKYYVWADDNSNPGFALSADNKLGFSAVLGGGVSYFFPKHQGAFSLGVFYLGDIMSNGLGDFIQEFSQGLVEEFPNLGTNNLTSSTRNGLVNIALSWRMPLARLAYWFSKNDKYK